MPIKLLSDENFDNKIVRGVRRKAPLVDFTRVQDVGLSRTPDDVILEWAAQNDYILVSHDNSTIPPIAYDRINNGLKMCGVFIVPDDAPIGKIVDDLVFLAEGSQAGEWDDQIIHLPL
jgi:Domain of unknown function (DUF5615)